jgi:hypothetical protein
MSSSLVVVSVVVVVVSVVVVVVGAGIPITHTIQQSRHHFPSFILPHQVRQEASLGVRFRQEVIQTLANSEVSTVLQLVENLERRMKEEG